MLWSCPLEVFSPSYYLQPPLLFFFVFGVPIRADRRARPIFCASRHSGFRSFHFCLIFSPMSLPACELFSVWLRSPEIFLFLSFFFTLCRVLPLTDLFFSACPAAPHSFSGDFLCRDVPRRSVLSVFVAPFRDLISCSPFWWPLCFPGFRLTFLISCSQFLISCKEALISSNDCGAAAAPVALP